MVIYCTDVPWLFTMYTCWSFIVQMFLSVYYVYLLVIYCTDVIWVFCLICIPVGHLLYRCSWLFNMHTCWSFIVQFMFLSVYYVYLLDIYCTHVLECLLCIPVGHLLYTCSWVFTMHTCWSFIYRCFWLFTMYICWSFIIHMLLRFYYVYLLAI